MAPAAMALFLSVVSGLDWETCRAVTDEHNPGGADRALEEADFFFGSDLPALQAWTFGPEQAASMSQPVLSVLGSEDASNCSSTARSCSAPGSRRSRS